MDKDEISYMAKLATNYPLNKKVNLQLAATNNSPVISVNGKQFSYFQMDAGIRAKMFNNKGALVIKVIDVLYYELTSLAVYNYRICSAQIDPYFLVFYQNNF